MSKEGFIAPEISDLSEWLEGYEVIELVACGGMGAVYRARQISLDRFVALKVLPPELAADETFRGSFEAEAKAMAQLAHSNLIGVYDFGEIRDMLYLVMEFVEGSTLYESSFGRVVDAQTAVDLVKQVARGLGEAHEHGIVHRDIKPANILITPSLVPKLGDFGLAVPHVDVGSGLVMGTPAYLAPEVLEDPLTAGFSSDTYGLGVILYELLTGQSVENGHELDLDLVPAHGGVRDLVQRATSETIAMRFQDGAEMAQALAKWEKNAGRRIVATTVNHPVPTKTVVVQSGGKGGLVVAILAIVVLGVALLFFLNGNKDPDGGVAGGPGDQAGDTGPPPLTPSDPEPPLTSGNGNDDEPEEAGGEPGEMPDEPAPLPGLEKLQEAQKALVLAESKELLERRRRNAEEFERAIGPQAKQLLAGIPEEAGDLPRFFQHGKVSLDQELAEQFDEYANRRQVEADQWFWERLRALHGAALKDLPEGAPEIPKEIRQSPEAWLEWLGLMPMAVACRTLCGEWAESGRGEELRFIVRKDGSAIWISEPGGVESVASWEMTDAGEIILHSVVGQDRKWTLRWRPDELVGADDSGKSYRFRTQPFNFFSLIGGAGEEGAMPGDLAEAELTDKDVLALRGKYLESLKERIEPLETGYLRVLTKAHQLYEKRDDIFSQERIEREMAWVKELAWREGKLSVNHIPEPTDVPVSQDPQQSIFIKAFRTRYGELQQKYLAGLQQLKRERERTGKPIDEIESELALLAFGEDVVVARYVKLESRKTEGVNHAVVAEFEILDQTGEALDRDAYGEATSSSHEPGVEGKSKLRPASHAFDGNQSSHWHTQWCQERAPFPHWIAVDLRETRAISGFRIRPRQNHWERHVDIVNWAFYVSNDGENWRKVATGTFPKGPAWREHTGFRTN